MRVWEEGKVGREGKEGVHVSHTLLTDRNEPTRVYLFERYEHEMQVWENNMYFGLSSCIDGVEKEKEVEIGRSLNIQTWTGKSSTVGR